MTKRSQNPPAGTGVIFRWSFRDRLGRVHRPKHGRPFAIPIGPRRRRRYTPPPPEQLALFSPEVLFPPRPRRPQRPPSKVRAAKQARGKRR